MFRVILLLIISTNCYNLQTFQDTIKIGAIFEEKSEHLKDKAFYYAVKKINNRQLFNDFEVEAIVKYIKHDDPFEAWQATCSLLTEGVVAIVGPNIEENSNVVQSICDAKDIPQLEVRWDDQILIANSIVNIYPYQDVLLKLYKDVLIAWEWKDFIILYEDNQSLKKVVDLLRLYNEKDQQVVIRQLDKEKMGNYRTVLKEVRSSGATHFLIDCSIDILEEVLRQAQQMGLMTSQYNYMITNLDLHTLNLTPFQYSGANITGMRFVNPEDDKINKIAKELLKTDFAGWKLQLETALLIDIVMMYAEALHQLPENFDLPQINCTSLNSWTYGSTLINFMKRNRYNGLTGDVKFDNKGYRSEFSLEIIELKEGGIIKVGTWQSEPPALNITRVYAPPLPSSDQSLVNQSFTVIIALTEPYAMLKETSEQLFGNSAYEGYAIDLIKALSIMEGFSYNFIVRKDKSNGVYDPLTNQWTGMIGDVISGKAHLAITDLTITSDREEAVEFTTPFMNLGISILYQKAKSARPSFFSFAQPFALGVWELLAIAYFGVSVSLYIMGRICPAEWTNPYPCIEEPDYLISQLSFANCLWFNIGSLMQQGCDFAPIALSTRIVSGMWWFFVVIIVACYTANLAACLTTELTDPEFTNVYELVQNAEKFNIKYGAKLNGATETFFKDYLKRDEQGEEDKVFRKIAEFLQEHYNEVMVKENKDGVLKAMNDDSYAFFMESTSIEYEIERKCNLQQVGGRLDEKGYGIATRKNETYGNILTNAILKLQQSGELEAIKRKWWKEQRGGGQCGGKEESNDADPLDLKNVGGVFWVTIIGTALALIMAICEMFAHSYRLSKKTKIPIKKLLLKEFKFFIAFSRMIKPVTEYIAPEGESTSRERTESEEKIRKS